MGEEFEAVVRIDARPGGKRFQGVWLERGDGERRVIAYRPEAWLRSFEGRRVRVTGVTYEPEGQAILATHFHVETLRAVEGEGPFVGFGPERTLDGRFARETVGAGAKGAGETYWTFVTADDRRFLIEHAPGALTDGEVVRIRARSVEPSPSWAARRGGDYLWVMAFESTP